MINTATNTVASDITVGPAPRQVVFSPDGSRAYVSTEHGVYVIDTATNMVIRSSRTPPDAGPGPEPRRDHPVRHRPGRGPLVSTPTGQLRPDRQAGAEPWSVGVTPDGTTLYVADITDRRR